MKISITAESTIDLPKELLSKFDITTLPYSILLGDELAEDGVITPEQIFEYVNQTKQLPKTGAINEQQYRDFFIEQLEKSDAVIHFALSSGLSCSCQNAKEAAKGLSNVYVIDTLALSTGIALQAIYARKLVTLGLKPEEIVKKVEQKVPYTQTSFVLQKLNYLYKGGRCSALSMFGANLLGIKPQIIVKQGKMGPHHKYRGTMEKVVSDYCRDTLKEFNTPDLENAFITYTTATEGMVAEARNALKQAGFINIYETRAGATITSHCGENCLGILYINKKD